MDSFERREEAFERAFSHDNELRFKVRARRDRRLGAWAAEMLGLTGDAAKDYAVSLAERQLQGGDDETLVADLTIALDTVEPKISAHRIRRRLEEFGAEAARAIQAGR
jgi:hypothetical protein